MTDVTQIRAQRFQESEAKRHNHEAKKVKEQSQQIYQKEVSTNEAMLARMRQEYEGKAKNLNIELEQRLQALRNVQKVKLEEETVRLEKELENIKKVHENQIEEIKSAQNNEISNLVESHKNTLENAQVKFRQERAKTEGKA